MQRSALLLLCCTARAQAQAEPPAGGASGAGAARCAEADVRCACERDASCWDFAFLWSDPHSLLGLETTFSAALLDGEQQLDASALATYSAESFRASGWLNGRVSLHGALGAGSAGNAGVLDATLDFGIRIPVTRYSGPVLRVGPSGAWSGNDAFELRLFEPLRASLGFQRMAGDQLLEGGLTAGLASTSRFRVAAASTSLTGALEFGTYLSARFEQLRFTGQALRVKGGPSGGDAELGLLRVEGCGYLHGLALCADAAYAQAPLQNARRTRELGRVFYAGITAGLTP
jgi:hypothetical protein